ncbi:hypothetical protein FDP22_17720 [Paroceanicella profunda]|uniref:Uncharacterized protein n=1 Tax=Paroceanicella profunda TaxID=2579971 RepID=A0A5B8FIT0_9RHOB|nr:hypothetical protein [Paroceanicella profunda]QDL93458.1 hypothetical protein FDP22_17720 [Paroceanicella profunda]
MRLVNEVRETGRGQIDVARDVQPIAQPFHEDTGRVHDALPRIGGTRLNDIRARMRGDIFPLRNGGRLARDLAGLTGLPGALDTAAGAGSEIALVTGSSASAAPGHPRTLEGLCATSDPVAAASLSRLSTFLDLDFDGLVQALGPYVVAQESGAPVRPEEFASVLLANDAPLRIETVQGQQAVHCEAADLAAAGLRSLHSTARLHHAPGLGFHHLGVLLAMPGATAASATSGDLARAHVTATGLRPLAGHLLCPEARAAFFGEVSPFRCADSAAQASEASATGL